MPAFLARSFDHGAVMKRCPFCAEEIQDAATVCKHCGRELQGTNAGAVMVRSKSRGGLRRAVMFAVLGGMGIFVVGGVLATRDETRRVLHPSLNNHHVGSDCRLSGENAPALTRRAPDLLHIINRDGAPWEDAEIRVYGQITNGPRKGPTGVYTLHQTLKPGLTEILLSEFQKPDGSPWVSAVMHADGVGIDATLRGERCEVEIPFDQALRP